ncbi:MAG: Fe-S cluster assembly protein SufD [Anaerolineales bacterium]
MAKRNVVTRRTHTPQVETGEFTFTRQMVTALGADGYPTFLSDYRRRAWEAFENLSMPTTSDEPWRRTDIRQLQSGAFRLPQMEDVARLEDAPEELLHPVVDEDYGGQVLLLPGGAKVSLDPKLAAKGVVFTDLARAELEQPQIMEKILGKIVRPEEGKFAALAGALAKTGVLLYVPPGLQLEQPMQSILWGPGSGLAYISHVLVWVDDGASLTYVHEAASHTESQGQTLHAGLVEVHVGAGASLRFVELQSWGEHVWNFSHERARVDRDGNLDWIFGALGSHLTKNFSDIDLIGEGASGRMSGFYFTDGKQHLDLDTQQNHLAAHTTSDLLYKGALEDSSRSVWQGMIYVAPGAQKTDGYQANRNLTLSPKARADSIPGLEILADDVRCTHGATVGKIDPELVFYLQSRGIPLAEAERLVVEGFFDPIMQRIPFEGVRARFQDAIQEKLR